VLKVKRAFLGVIFEAGAVAGAAGKCEGDALVGARETCGAIEGYAARLDVSGAGFRERRTTRDEFGVGRAHSIDANVAAAGDVAGFLVVLTAVCADNVVAIGGFAENGDDDFFEQAGVLAFEFGGFGGLDLEDGAVLLDLFEIDAVGLAGDIFGGRGGRLFALWTERTRGGPLGQP